MNRVSERIEDRRHFLVDVRIVPPDIRHRQRNIFRERSRPVHAHALGMRAKVPPPRKAVTASAANHVSFPADDVARMKVADVRSHCDDLAHEFVPDRHGHGNGRLCPIVPIVDVQVGAANPGVAHANQNVVDAVSPAAESPPSTALARRAPLLTLSFLYVTRTRRRPDHRLS